jgi:hypothetical protein
MLRPSEVEARRAQLQAAVAGHKAAIRRHRADLARAKAALVTFEAACRAHGIGVHSVSEAKESLHGRPISRSA